MAGKIIYCTDARWKTIKGLPTDTENYLQTDLIDDCFKRSVDMAFTLTAQDTQALKPSVIQTCP